MTQKKTRQAAKVFLGKIRKLLTTRLYQKTDKQTTERLQYDPVTGAWVVITPEPEPEPEPEPQQTDPAQHYISLAEAALAAAKKTDRPELQRYWLSQAEKAFGLAGVVLGPGAGDLGPGPGAGGQSNSTQTVSKNLTTGATENEPHNSEKSPPGAIPYSIRVHSVLSQKIIADKEFTRAYALWLVLRSLDGPGHLDKQSVISLAMGQTGKAQSTIYEWLTIGEGIFWISDGGRLWLIGKDKVFNRFLGEGVQPGAVVLVPSNLVLTSKLHMVRANLSSTFITSDNGKIAARITRRNIFQGVPERTQQTYDRTAGVRIRPLSVRSKTQKKQLSNQYFRPNNLTTLGVKKPSKDHFFGYRPVEYNAVVNAQMSVAGNGGSYKFGGLRQYFNDAKRAVAVAEYRKENDIPIPVYWLNPDDKKDSGPAQRVTWLW